MEAARRRSKDAMSAMRLALQVGDTVDARARKEQARRFWENANKQTPGSRPAHAAPAQATCAQTPRRWRT
eukprot:2018138-Prymnesium_polylepis.1